MFISALLSSCVSDNWATIGNNLIETESQFIYIDNLDVSVSTFRYDSLVTSGTKVALIGQFTDNTMGTLQSSSYLPFGSNSLRITGDNAVFDSIQLNLYQSGYNYGDTLYNTTINVHRVTEEIEYGDNTTSLYNNTSFSYDPEVIGSLSYLFVPSDKEELTINLSYTFGQELFSYLRLPARPDIEEQGLSRYFKGLHVAAGSGSNSIVGYFVNDTSFYLRLYYHLGNNNETALSYDIKCISTGLQFNNISTDSQNAIMSKLSEDPISSDSTNNCGFIQGGSGIFTRIDFRNLREFYQQHQNYQIVKAELQICPSKEMNLDYLPQKLNVYYTNKNNELLSQLTNSSGTALDGSLVKDDIFYGKTFYTWDVTSFVRSIAASSSVENDGLLLIPEKYNNTFEQLIVADQKYDESTTKLKLYILSHE